MWTKTFGGTGWDWGYYVEQTTDGGYIITGCKDPGSYGIWDTYLIKTDSEGNTMWTKTFGGDSYDVGHCVKQTTNGGYILTGYTYSCGAGSSDMWLIKTDGNGNLEWDNTFGDTEPEHGYSVVQVDDEYIITGYTKSYGEGDYDVWLLKIDNEGDTLWTKTIGDDNLNRARSVVQTSDGGYILAGDTYIYEQGEYNYYLVKIDSKQGVGINNETQTKPSSFCYPNPTTGIITIQGEDIESVEITNVNGQIIERFQVLSPKFQIDLSGQVKGIYFLKTQTDSQISINKIIVK